jgi:hypothetical protein
LKRFRQMLGVASLAPALASAAEAKPAFPQSELAAFAPRTDPAFGDATPALARLVAETRPHGPQHFCAIGYRAEGGPMAWVHWQEAERLILWHGRGDGSAPGEALLHSNRRLDLNADVVAREADLAGSTYRVTRAWVSARLADCEAKGDRYVIES